MLHVVDFRTAADTGRTNSDSIAPILNGESADQTAFRRPTENNRSRTQTLRDRVRDNMMRHDYASCLLFGGGTITTAGAGGSELTFTTTADLYVLPPATAGTDAAAPYVASTKSSLSVGTPSNNEIVFTSVKKANEGFTNAADVNSISVEIVDGGVGAPLTVVVTDRHILITIDEGVHNCTAVISTVNADVNANVLVLASLGSGSTGTNLCASFDATTWTSYTDRFLRGGVPGLAHKITAAGLATFFSTAANRLNVGDTLAVAYDQLVSATTTGGRLQSTPENTNITVDTALFNTRRYPSQVPNCIPICKRVAADALLFVTGDVFYSTRPALLGYDSLMQAAIDTDAENASLATPLNWDRIGDGPDHNPPTTIREALDNTDGRLDETMDEVEAARSTDFLDPASGGYSDLDARLERHAGHSRVVVTVGESAHNCMYSSIVDAVTYLNTTDGGTIFFRGAYSHTVTGSGGTQIPSISKPIRFVATEPVTITNERGSGLGWLFDFVTGSSGSSLEGITIVEGAGASQQAIRVAVHDFTLLRCTLTGEVQWYNSGAVVPLRGFIHQCSLLGASTLTTYYALHITSADQLMVSQCTIHNGDQRVGVDYANTAGKVTVVDCVLTSGNGDRALQALASTGLRIKNVTVNCAPFTSIVGGGYSAIYIAGSDIYVDGLTCLVAGTNDIVNTILWITASNVVSDVVVRNIVVNCNGQYLKYSGAASQNPVQLAGNFVVEHFRMTNFKIPNSSIGSFTLSKDYPIVRVTGAATGILKFQHGIIDAITFDSSGSITTAAFLGPDGLSGIFNDGGPVDISDFHFQGHNLNPTTNGLEIICNLGSGSRVRKSRFVLGQVSSVVYVSGSGLTDVRLEDNIVDAQDSGDSLNGAFTIKHSGTSAEGPSRCTIVRNYVYLHSSTNGTTIISIVGDGTGGNFARHNQLCDNHVIMASTSTSIHTMIYYEDMQYSIIMRNIVYKGNGSNLPWPATVGDETGNLPLIADIADFNISGP